MAEHTTAGCTSPEPGRRTAQDGKTRAFGGLFGLVVLVMAVGGAFVLWGGGFAGVEERDVLRPFGDVPDFTLLERSGRQFTKADFLGKVWIVDFIFTRCVERCPLVSSRMAALQKAFVTEDDVRLVSITVDPEHDTPAILARYAAGFGAHPQRWLFFTGDKASIYRLAREGFHLGVFDPQEAPRTSIAPRLRLRQVLQYALQRFGPAVAWAHHGAHSEDGVLQAIQHSARLVLVDRRGRIRQYYDSNDENALTRLQYHVQLLLRER